MESLKEIFLGIVNMSLTASYAAIVIILVRLVLKKAPKIITYGLWFVVLFRLLCPISFQSEYSVMKLFYFPQVLGIASVGDEQNADQNPTDMEINSEDFSTTDRLKLINQEKAKVYSRNNDEVVNTMIKKNKEAYSNYKDTWDKIRTNLQKYYIDYLSIIWILGFLSLFVYSLISYNKIRRKVQTAICQSGNVYESDQITSPFVFGLTKPKIYLPLGIGEEEISYILKHEQIHIKRYDHVVKVLYYAALIIHWFNPIIWMSFQLMSKDMEMSCDERVMKEMGKDVRCNYSNSLLILASQQKIHRPSLLAFGESNVKTRIKNILNYKKASFSVLMTTGILSILIVISLISNPNDIYNLETHPYKLLGGEKLQVPVKLRIQDQTRGEEYLITERDEIVLIMQILKDIRISRKSSTGTSSKSSMYTVTLYNEIDAGDQNYDYSIHLGPLWIDNGLKSSFPNVIYKMNNEKDILGRMKQLFDNRGGEFWFPVEFLYENKTLYIGNHSKTGTLVGALTYPEGVVIADIALQTKTEPYGLTVNYYIDNNTDYLNSNLWEVNSIMLFATIENMGEITYAFYYPGEEANQKENREFAASISYTRSEIEKMIGEDVRPFNKSIESLAELVDKIGKYYDKPSKDVSVVHSEVSLESEQDSEHIENENLSNTIENEQQSNIIENENQSNTIGDNNQSSTIVNENQSNTIGDKNQSSTIKNENHSNTIGDKNQSSTIENENQSNTIENQNQSNLIENELSEPSVNIVSSISPDNRYRIETYGKNTSITAGGLYPAEGIRINELETGDIRWEATGAYDSQFLWSPDSRYVAITNTTRISSEVTIVDVSDFTAITIPIPEDIQKNMREFRPDPYLSAESWSDSKTVQIGYYYIDKNEQEMFGEFNYTLE